MVMFIWKGKKIKLWIPIVVLFVLVGVIYAMTSVKTWSRLSTLQTRADNLYEELVSLLNDGNFEELSKKVSYSKIDDNCSIPVVFSWQAKVFSGLDSDIEACSVSMARASKLNDVALGVVNYLDQDAKISQEIENLIKVAEEGGEDFTKISQLWQEFSSKMSRDGGVEEEVSKKAEAISGYFSELSRANETQDFEKFKENKEKIDKAVAEFSQIVNNRAGDLNEILSKIGEIE